VERDALREDLAASFAKYQFRILPVVDAPTICSASCVTRI